MDSLWGHLVRAVEQLIARADGPLHFRLMVMPTVVTIVAIRAGLRDARQGQSAFLWTLLTNPADRPRLLRSAVKDIGRILVMAVVLDTTYQLWVFRWLYPLQVLIVAVACAVVPYVLIRGPVTRIARRLWPNPLGRERS